MKTIDILFLISMAICLLVAVLYAFLFVCGRLKSKRLERKIIKLKSENERIKNETNGITLPFMALSEQFRENFIKEKGFEPIEVKLSGSYIGVYELSVNVPEEKRKDFNGASVHKFYSTLLNL
jgi:hypothetical protein